MKEYSLKQLEKAKKLSYEKLDNTPLIIPVDMRQPETYNEAIARILHHSGVISSDDYAKLRGNVFDFDGDDEDWSDDDFDDEVENFSMPLSSYEEYNDTTSSFKAASEAGSASADEHSNSTASPKAAENSYSADDKGQGFLEGMEPSKDIPLQAKAKARAEDPSDVPF